MTQFAIFKGGAFGKIRKSESIFELLKTLDWFDCIKWKDENGNTIKLDFDTFKGFQKDGNPSKNVFNLLLPIVLNGVKMKKLNA